jgi:type IV secretion system protein VirB9
MKHSTFAVQALVFALALGANPAAAQAAKKVDPRIKTVTYNADAVIPLRGHLGYQMMIEFDPNERIENVSIGDSLAWQVVPNRKANLLFVKPVELGAATNMTVVTQTRRYTFQLIASEAAGPDDPTLVFGLRFRYPDEKGPKVIELAAAPEAEPDPASMNFAYASRGSRRAAPSSVFDDGKFTYFQFPEGAEAPAIFAIAPDGEESLINSRVRGRSIMVDGVFERFVLRYGREKTTVTNTAFPKVNGKLSRQESEGGAR